MRRDSATPGLGGQISLGSRIVPVTAASVGIAFLLLLMPASERDYREVGIAAVLGGGLILLSLAWRRAPRLVELGVPIGYILVVAVLRDATGGSVSGFGGLYLLPIIYLALFSDRLGLLLGLAALTIANVVPLLAIGEPEYPLPGWRGSLVQVAAAAIAGFTIQWLVGEARAYAAQTAEQNAHLLELDRLKDEFVALVSHELRTPLTSIIGYLEMVIEGGNATLSGEQQTFLATVQRNVVRLSRLVDDLLFIARIDGGRMEVAHRRVELGLVLEEAADAARPVADGKDVTLELELAVLPPVEGDRARLAQLLDNLVSNAVKFTPSGGRVSIRASNGSGCVRVEVSDTGIGIPKDELPRLFTRFYRATTARTSETPGTGLGLAISQSIAEAHGSKIEVASEPNVGSTFAFELPLAAPS
jgi:signal transduction histidine kinase